MSDHEELVVSGDTQMEYFCYSFANRLLCALEHASQADTIATSGNGNMLYLSNIALGWITHLERQVCFDLRRAGGLDYDARSTTAEYLGTFLAEARLFLVPLKAK